METKYDVILDDLREKDAGGSTPGGGIPIISPTTLGAIPMQKADGTLADSGIAISTVSVGWNRMLPDSMGDFEIDEANRNVKLKPKNISNPLVYYIGGRKVTRTANLDYTITDASGIYYCLTDFVGNSVIKLSHLITMKDFYDYAFVCICVYSKEGGIFRVVDERHSFTESPANHAPVHYTVGTRYGGGIDITGLVAGGTEYVNFGAGSIWDEDIRHYIETETATPFLYRLGVSGDYHLSAPDLKLAYKQPLDTYCCWNRKDPTTGEYTLQEGASDSDFWFIFDICIPFLTGNKVFKLIGQNSYASRSEARDNAFNELNKMQLDGLPGNEYIITQAYLVKRNGKIQELSDGSLTLDIYSHRVVDRQAGLQSNITQYDRIESLILPGAVYELDDTLPDGFRILIHGTGNICTVKPKNNDEISLYDGITLDNAIGVVSKGSGPVSIGLVKAGTSWLPIEVSGRWDIEGIGAWFDFSVMWRNTHVMGGELPIIKEHLYSQDLICSSGLKFTFASPYNKSSAANIFSTFADMTADFGGGDRCQVYDAKHVNIFESLTGSGAIEMKINKSGGDGDYRIIAEFNIDNDNRWGLFINPTNQIEMDAHVGGVKVLDISGGSMLAADGWKELAVLFDDGTVSIYIDGARVATGTITSAVTGIGTFTVASNNLNQYNFIGQLADMLVSTKKYMVGKVTDVSIGIKPNRPEWVSLNRSIR